jgi:hypothetical protein
MKYRLILKVGYYEAWFEFDSIREAGAFAEAILVHQIPNEDTNKKIYITVQVVDKNAESEEE